MAKVKVLPVDVYGDLDRGLYDCDCTNGGISSRNKRLYLICEGEDRGYGELEDTDERLVRIVHSTPCGKPYVHAEPVNDPNKKEIGYMFGGHFIYTSDGRFPEDYPVPLHDRSETQEEYDILSR